MDTNNLYAVTTNATTETLHQLLHNLTPIQNRTLKGFDYVLLPFVKNDTLISCGVTDHKLCSFCEILDLKNISKILYSEHVQVGPQRRGNGSVSFLVDVKKDSAETETYILTAIQNHRDKTEENRCATNLNTINLYSTGLTGEIFSWSDHGSDKTGLQTEADVEFVDGFQINSTVYLFSNVASGAKANKVRLIWLQAETNKAQTLKSLRGATLSTSDGGEGSRLLASSVIPGGQPVLWSGVFSLDGGQINTHLLLFDISPDSSKITYRDPDFYSSVDKPDNPSEPGILKPKKVLFKKKYMSSVLVVRQDSWMVFFIGTTNGVLIKLAVDKNNVPACPEELYRASRSQKELPKIHLDPVDRKYVYLQSKDKIIHIPVSKCNVYKNVKDCCTAQDPYCVWCYSERRCTFKDDCKGTEWLSIPDESHQEVVSHRSMNDNTGKVKVVVQVHLTVTQKVQSNFSCQITTTFGQLCRPNRPQPQYPQCTCILADALTTTGQ
ncbi:hypothetical protein ATANTOWER_016400 [Ataeniobius toweri]|uniref:PSI domain-containing protein n=1 Tax=Ataeniobius toweri TaxID=208326 RepID=A0ABU7CHG4_9TELE|nr:hypothetical protein [Ataeniobius toweri]